VLLNQPLPEGNPKTKVVSILFSESPLFSQIVLSPYKRYWHFFIELKRRYIHRQINLATLKISI
jgi:hypothetical protein